MNILSDIHRHCCLANKGHEKKAIEWLDKDDGVTLRSMSYRHVWLAASTIAAHLKGTLAMRRSPEHEQPVIAVHVTGGPYLVLSCLAVWLCRGVYTPASASLHPQRYIHVDAHLMESPAIAPPSPHEAPCLVLQDLLGAPGTPLPPTAPPPADVPLVDPTTLAWIYWTSGTTRGVRKGIRITHQAVALYARGKQAAHAVDASSRVLLAARHTFDPSLGDVVATLLAGATCCCSGDAGLVFRAPAVVAHRLAVTHVTTTPTLWRGVRVATATGADADTCPPLASLQVLALGGERIDAALVARWASRVSLWSLYGVTECCVYQTTQRIRTVSDTRCIGTPLSPETVVTLDAETGALLISGPCVGQGYVNAEATLTASERAAFSSDYTCYRTGDMGKRRPDDGALILCGRLDRQVKVRGTRLELPCIEDTLLSLSTIVQQAFVRLSGDVLVAWIVPTRRPADEETDGSTQGAVRVRYANALLADVLTWSLVRFAAIPRGIPIVFGEIMTAPHALPCTETGKLDLARLPLPSAWTPGSRGSLARTVLTPTEAFVADAWARVLKLPDTMTWHPCDDFRHLGGDSLTSILVSHRIQGTCVENYNLTPRPPQGQFLEACQPSLLLAGPTTTLCHYAENLEKAFGPAENVPAENLGSPGSDTDDTTDEETEVVSYVWQACRVGDAAIVMGLVDACASTLPVIELPQSLLNACLLVAAAQAHPMLCRKLLEGGAKPTATHRLHQQAVHVLCGRSTRDRSTLACLQLLLVGREAVLEGTAGQGADATETDATPAWALVPFCVRTSSKQTMLHVCARSGRADAMHVIRACALRRQEMHLFTKMLCMRDRWDRTPLHWALLHGHFEVVDVLLDYGAAVLPEQRRHAYHEKKTTQEQETPLDIAARLYGKQGVYEKLVAALENV